MSAENGSGYQRGDLLWFVSDDGRSRFVVRYEEPAEDEMLARVTGVRVGTFTVLRRQLARVVVLEIEETR